MNRYYVNTGGNIKDCVIGVLVSSFTTEVATMKHCDLIAQFAGGRMLVNVAFSSYFHSE